LNTVRRAFVAFGTIDDVVTTNGELQLESVTVTVVLVRAAYSS
jgi:hypothetical protein